MHLPKPLHILAFVSALCCGAGAAGLVACGDDDAIVRERLDGGPDADLFDANEASTLACGVAIPTSYASPSFATNAAVEIALADHFAKIVDKMKATENTGTGTVTAAELKVLYNEGTPSLRAVSTTAAQTTIDEMFDVYGAAFGKAWTPADAEQDGGALAGGKYDTTYHVSPTGLDLRAFIEKVVLGGALYNHALAIVAAPIGEATSDQLLASFGASVNFANGADAGPDSDKLIAEFASKRDDKSLATPGIYRKIKSALITLKAAVAGGDKCKADRDAAVQTFLTEWERATYASAINALSAAAASAANPQNGTTTLHGFAEALGFIQSFRGLPVEKRKIRDSQIDTVLLNVGSTTPHKLVTNPGDRALKLNEAVKDIALYEGFEPAEVEAFKKNF